MFKKIHFTWLLLVTGTCLQAETQLPDSLCSLAADTARSYILIADSSGTLHSDSTVVPDTSGADSVLSLEAQDTMALVSAPVYVPAINFRTIENHAFQTGEYLEFEIAWKFFKAGTATMSVNDTVYNDRPCYHIKTTANSSSAIDVFYKVRDRVESIVDKKGMFPWRFEKHLREGNFRRDRFTEFDPLHQVAYLKKDTIDIPLYVQDILSSFYYIRIQPLEVGKYVDIENLSDRKVYPLRVLVHKKEKVSVPAGKFKCIVVEPVLRGEGLFNQKGRLRIWLTDDVRKMPVMMKSEVFIGSVDVKLRKFENTIKE